MIADILDKYGIKYVYPYVPGGNCRDSQFLRYDFRVGNWLVEFQGKQHYMPVSYYGVTSDSEAKRLFRIQQKHDVIKRNWAKKNGFKFLAIPYDRKIKLCLIPLIDDFKERGLLSSGSSVTAYSFNENRFDKILHKRYPELEMIGRFYGMSCPVEFKCHRCGHIFMLRPTKVLETKYGCRYCAVNAETKSRAGFVQELKKRTPTVELLGGYYGGEVLTKFKCRVCGFTYMYAPHEALRNKFGGCKHCAHVSRFKSQVEFVKKLERCHPYVTVLSKYRGYSFKVLIRCNICGHVWFVTPDNLFHSKFWCPRCRDYIRWGHPSKRSRSQLLLPAPGQETISKSN